MQTTGILLAISSLMRLMLAALAIMAVGVVSGRIIRGRSGTRPNELAYRSNASICWIAILLFIEQLFATRTLPWQPGEELGPQIAAALELPILFVSLAIAYRQARLGSVLGDLLTNPREVPYRQSKNKGLVWPGVGLGAILAAFAFLEHKQPYYFTQDDNLAVNLAEILNACHSFFAGVFPTWNPYQFMGSPNTSLGWYALTYPPTYISYWIARTILGNENATLEVFAFLHLVAAYLAIYWVIRREGCRESIAMLGAMCCVTSGYALVFSRSWFQFSPVLVWTPLMLAGVQSLARRGARWQWIAAFGVVLGVAFHAGHVQMWIYSVLLADFAILALLVLRVIPVRAVFSVVAAHFLALAIAAPLLVPEASILLGVLRRHPVPGGIAADIPQLFVPVSRACSLPSYPGSPSCQAEMCYSGTLFIVLVALLLVSFIASRWTKETARTNLWFFFAIGSFLAALGDRELLWRAMSLLPVFSGFRFPFKFLAYLVIFAAMAGGVVLERSLRRSRQPLRLEMALVAAVFCLVAYHVAVSTASFYNYAFLPYPAPDPVLQAKLAPGDDKAYPKFVAGKRGFSVEKMFPEGGYRNTAPDFFNSYMNQWPTVLRAFSMDGYNPLISESPVAQRVADRLARNPAQAMAEYGVQYVLQYDLKDRPIPLPISVIGEARVIYSTDDIVLQELPKPRPMAFSVDSPAIPLPVSFDGSGATIGTRSMPRGGHAVLNMLWRKEFRATASGQRLPVTSDEWDRIVVTVPENAPEVRLDYRPPWGQGLALSLIALVCSVSIGWFATANRALLRIPDAEPERELVSSR